MGKLAGVAGTLVASAAWLAAWGDGCYFRTVVQHAVRAEVSSSAQRALLVWRDGQETLHLQSNYMGPAGDFAWVIPVPGRPTVEKSSWKLFEVAEDVTRPTITVYTVERGGPLCCCGCAAAPRAARAAAETESSVMLLESLEIEELHIDIVAARDGGGFVEWLRGRDYAVEQTAEPILQEYIDKSFYFVAAKIAKVAAAAPAEGTTEFVSGGLTPLAITFASSKPFYPLRISAISAAPESELLLLTVTPFPVVPETCGWTVLENADVERALGREVRRRAELARPALPGDEAISLSLIDFAPAIKAAQKRMGTAGLVLGAASSTHWELTSDGELHHAPEPSPQAAVRILRFHGFLKPEEMTDLAFRLADVSEIVPRDVGIPGRFRVHLRAGEWFPVPEAGLLAVGVALAVASLAKVRRVPWLRLLATVVLLASVAVGA